MRNTKKILTTTLTLVLMVVVLGTGVFAWFTINTKTSATGLSGTADAVDAGFYLRLVQDNHSEQNTPWKDKINFSELLSNELENLKLKDLTTNPERTKLVNLKDAKGNVNKDYIELEIEMLTSKTNNEIFLTKLLFGEEDKYTTWNSEVTFEYETKDIKTGDIFKAQLSDALRVSIDAIPYKKGDEVEDVKILNIFEKHAKTLNEGEQSFEITQGTENNDSSTITFSNTNGFNGFAQHYFRLINDMEEEEHKYKEDESLDDELSRIQGVNADKALDNAEGKTDKLIATAKSFEEYYSEALNNLFPDITNDEGEVDNTYKYGKIEDSAGNEMPVDKDNNYITKVRVLVWLEGWDGEAFNAVASGEVNISLYFESREPKDVEEPEEP